VGGGGRGSGRTGERDLSPGAWHKYALHPEKGRFNPTEHQIRVLFRPLLVLLFPIAALLTEDHERVGVSPLA